MSKKFNFNKTKKFLTMSLMDFGNETDAEIMSDLKPTAWQTWGFGLIIVSITAFGPSICIIIVPFLNKTLYELFMTFLVAFGIGTLSGSTLYVLLPGVHFIHSFFFSGI
ncbi:unnamed protein product [Wuchereria bancrofti]|uniref:Uncharacterized protein n=1 Tax=Wuchereria bancrofti TaxID=6293 RepID=A0A3P7FWX8_WUCBA|nr:unnamed protein product [Wuchereria bancrofti]